MYDLRFWLFYSYIAYSFFLPTVFIFLLFVYKNFSSFLIQVIIIDTILFLILLVTLYLLHNRKKRFWVYVIVIITVILITIRNLYLSISIIYRTMTEFEKKKAVFSDAIDRQINILQESQHPVWAVIIRKQCCSLNSKYGDAKTVEYQWFRQTPFLHFCPGLHLKGDQVTKFEHMFQMKYSPQGPCLLLVNNELKLELILISIDLGFSILLMLLSWLFVWQDRVLYLELLKNMLQKQVIEEPVKSDVLETPVDKLIEVEIPKASEPKRLYKGYLPSLEDG